MHRPLGEGLISVVDVFTQFKVRYFESSKAGRLALVTMDNGADHRKPSTCGEEALRSLHAARDVVEAQPDV